MNSRSITDYILKLEKENSELRKVRAVLGDIDSIEESRTKIEQLKKLLTEANINPLYHPAKVLSVEEIPKLGSGKNDYGATKKIALANPN